MRSCGPHPPRPCASHMTLLGECGLVALHQANASGKQFDVWEGHYDYAATTLTFVPARAGGMFEGLMAKVMPETTWGTRY